MTILRLRIAVVLLAIALSPVIPSASGQNPGTTGDEQKLMEIERQMNDADARHDAEQMSKFLDDAYLVKSMDGKVFDKSAALMAIRMDAAQAGGAPDPPAAPKLDGLKVATLEESGLAVSTVTMAMGSRTLRCRMTDTFLRRADGWKLVGRAADCH